MATRIGVNGFGRVGRQVLKAIRERHGSTLEVAAINDTTDPRTNAYLFKHDSTYGPYPGPVEATESGFWVDGEPIRVFAETQPEAIPWGMAEVAVVVEATGRFTDTRKARAHLHDSVRKVVVAAPTKHDELTIVLGVNEHAYDPTRHHIISNASCTTNGLAPVAKVLHEQFGIERGLLTTVHAYTNSQRLLDGVAKDLRDARAAALNIVPSSTGAARAIGLVIPELQGKINGLAFRVPTPTVSVVDFTVDLQRETTDAAINVAFKEASEGRLKGILQYTEELLVSTDLRGNSHSSIVSAPDTLVVDGTMAKVVAWYDNEWGYACRVADLCALVATKGW